MDKDSVVSGCQCAVRRQLPLFASARCEASRWSITATSKEPQFFEMPDLCPLCSISDAIVELAACKHMICSSCFYEYRDRSSSECPICIVEMSGVGSKEDSSLSFDDAIHTNGDNDSILNDEEDSIVVHGYKCRKECWQNILDKRLEDMKHRYEIYLDLFLASKCIFIHVPKTAGTSFESALFNIRNRSQHAPLSYWRTRFKSEEWKNIPKFAVVRHPFHRLISGYTYWKNGALAGQKVDQPFVHKCRTELNTLPKFVDYLVEVKLNNLWDCRDVQGFDGTCPVQFRPQLWFLINDE